MKQGFVLVKITLAAFLLMALYLMMGNVDNVHDTFSAIYKSDSAGVQALAEYADAVRKPLLMCSYRPEVVAELGLQAKRSADEFSALLKNNPRNVQEKVWEFMRYPGLLESMNRYTGDRLKSMLGAYPLSIQEDAYSYALDYSLLVSRALSIQTRFEAEKRNTFKTHGVVDTLSFNKALEQPEAFLLLTEHLNTAVLLGALYHEHPIDLTAALDQLRSELAEAKASALLDWQKQLKKDTVLQEEFKTSSKEFAQEQGAVYVEEVQTPPVYSYVYPYPYWCGYPWWYSYPMWYPYPYWYQLGYSIGPYGMIYFSLPSDYYFDWYFSAYPHHYYYPHFTDHCIRFYDQHRRTTGSIHRRINTWVDEADKRYPSADLHTEKGRAERIQTMARVEMDYTRERAANPNIKMDRGQFMNEHKADYPILQERAIEKRDYPVRSQPSETDKARPGVHPQANPSYERSPSPTEKASPRNTPKVDPSPQRMPSTSPRPSIPAAPEKRPMPSNQPNRSAPPVRTQPSPQGKKPVR